MEWCKIIKERSLTYNEDEFCRSSFSKCFGQKSYLECTSHTHTCLKFKLCDSVEEDNSASSICEIDKLL